jgi:hypothetical protein
LFARRVREFADDEGYELTIDDVRLTDCAQSMSFIEFRTIDHSINPSIVDRQSSIALQ